MFHDRVNAYLGIFISALCVYHFPIDVQRNLIQLPEVAHGDAMTGQSHHQHSLQEAGSPRSLPASGSQVTQPLQRKATGGLGKASAFLTRADD